MSLPPNVLSELEARYGADAVRRQLQSLERDRAAIDDADLWLRTALAGDFKDMPLERLTCCTCGSAPLVPLSRFVFWNLLGVAGCRSCGALAASPRLSDAAVSNVFADSYFAGDPPAYWGPRRAPVFAQLHREVARVGATRVLDVGAAYGHLLAYLRDRGIGGAGCDLSAAASAWGRERLGLSLYAGGISDVPTSEREFDAVLSVDALYYAADPLDDLRAMAARTRPGGWVIVRLRTGRGAWARAEREGRQPVGRSVMPAEHRWCLTPAAMERLMALAGLTDFRFVPGAHSRTRISALLDAAALANNGVRHVAPGFPILAQSYLAIGRRP